MEEYRSRIQDDLGIASEQSYLDLAALCMEDRYVLLSGYDRELLEFGRVISIWLREHAADYPMAETIIGRTAAFWELPLNELTIKQLTEIYTILKFSIVRLCSDLPMEDKCDGVERILALGLSPVAVLCAAELETQDKEEIIRSLVSVLERPEMVASWPEAHRLALILRGVMDQNL